MKFPNTTRGFQTMLVTLAGLLCLNAGTFAALDSTLDSTAARDSIAHGRYLIVTSGCNDCHTAGYMPSEGRTPEREWLAGDSFGWRGPWGTTYAKNLRLLGQSLTEDQWVEMARTLRSRPPMPWFNLNQMSSEDLRDIYQFLRHLGPRGSPAPDYLPVETEPPQPYAQFPE